MAPEISSFVARHGDGVKHVALTVSDVHKAFEATTSRGAEAVQSPMEMADEHGHVKIASVKTYGDVVHQFVDKKNYKGTFLPGFQPIKGGAFAAYSGRGVGLKYIDHLVGNVDWNEMDKWGDFYKRVFGMEQLISFDDKDISTKYTALKSKVMTIETGAVKYPINEPAKGLMKSQIEEYIEFNGGAGVQHIALATDDIIKTVNELRRRGVEFLRVPDTYYETVGDRVGTIKEDLNVLKELGILVDRDDKGYLLQIFTKPLGVRPTLFFEIIQRRGGFSFGKGNFRALFESIEEEQRRRGTL
jgi:4-hydroxyphenylpyruvate dioxygenase